MRVFAMLVAAFLLALTLTGCHPLVVDDAKPLSVYATFFPIYALTEPLMAGVPDASLHCLVQPQDGCLRAYQLSDWDAYMLSSADAVICGGRGLERFESMLFQLGEQGPAVSAVLYNLELIEGKGGGDREDSHWDGANPHLYMSVSGAKAIIESIAASLMALDPRYADQYAANEEAACAALDALYDAMRAAAGDVAGQPVILLNEALAYVARDYGLSVAAWYERESGEGLYGDALDACIERLRASNAKVVLIEKQAPSALVSSLEEAGFAVALIDILSTGREAQGFDGYIERQKNNALAIGRAFGKVKQ